jgi:hypothetical protein
LHNDGKGNMKKLAIVIVSMMTAFTGVGPVQAFPSVPVISSAVSPSVGAGEPVVQQAQYRDGRRYYRNDRRYDRRYDRRHDRRYDRRHSRSRSNAGAIIGGLAAGAIIGGAIASQNRGGNRSCAARYRSYRASDNTYQPNSGPRRVCR